MSEKQKISYELDVVDGLIVNKATGQSFDTAEAVTHWGAAIFVMDANGRIFASNHQEPELFHHSSLASGQPVAAAGTIEVVSGVLIDVSNKTGHYQTSQDLNNQFFDELEKRGVSSEYLENVTRSGFKDDGFPMEEKKHLAFKKASDWKPGDEIPDDWMDF